MANLIPQPWTFYGGLWHQKPEGGGGWVEGDDPVVSGFSGTFAEGNEITLTGSNFSASTQTPLFYTDFAGQTVEQRASNIYYASGSGDDYLVTNTGGQPVGAQAIYADPDQDVFVKSAIDLGQDYNEVFVEHWMSINKLDFTASPDAAQVKLTRIVDKPAAGEDWEGRVLHQDTTIEANHDLITIGHGMAANAYARNSSGTRYVLPDDTWVKYTSYSKKGTYNVADGERYCKLGGAVSFRQPNGQFLHSSSASVPETAYRGEKYIYHTDITAAYGFRTVVLTYYQRAQQTTVAKNAHILINSSQERVVIGDAAAVL